MQVSFRSLFCMSIDRGSRSPQSVHMCVGLISCVLVCFHVCRSLLDVSYSIQLIGTTAHLTLRVCMSVSFNIGTSISVYV